MEIKLTNTSYTAILSGAFITGIALGTTTSENQILTITAFILLITAIFLNKTFRKLILICLLIFIAGFSYSIYRTPQLSNNDISTIAPQKDIMLIGNVSSEPSTRTTDKLKFVLNVDKAVLNKQKLLVKGNVMVTVLDKYQQFDVIKIGNKLKVRGNLYIQKEASNPAQFDYNKYLKNKGITCSMFVLWDAYQILNSPESLKYKLLYHLNLLKDYIQEVHTTALGKHEAQLLGGIVLGERAIPMDQEIRQHFINSGLVHILAASGINVALLALAWIFVASRLALPHTVQIIGGMFVVLFYSLLTGLPPSVLRASIMLEFILLGKLIRKDADMIALITFVAVLLLLFNPYMITDIGFQLSFVTAFGLIISVPVFQKYIITLPQVLAMLVLIPFIAQIWAMPIILYHFHTLSSYSVVANFFAMPLVAIITYGGFVSSVISIVPYVGISIATFIDALLSPVLSVLLFIAEYISCLPFSLEHFAVGSVFNVILFYLIIIFILYAMWKEYDFKRYLIIFSSILLIFITLQLFKPYKDLLQITFFDVGDADCILVKTPGDKHILIDGGYRIRNSFSAADWVIKPYFYSNCINNIDAVILTHAQNDHIGGLPEVLEEFKIYNFFDPGFTSKNKAYQELLNLTRTRNINYKRIRETDSIIYPDGVKLAVLHPPEITDKESTINDNSVVIKLSYKDFSILLTGDAEKEVINNIKKDLLNVDILKIGHHGSKESINTQCLELTTPSLAIISAAGNKKHPSSETLQVLKKQQIPVLVTGQSGAITITSDGSGFNVQTFKNTFQKAFSKTRNFKTSDVLNK